MISCQIPTTNSYLNEVTVVLLKSLERTEATLLGSFVKINSSFLTSPLTNMADLMSCSEIQNLNVGGFSLISCPAQRLLNRLTSSASPYCKSCFITSYTSQLTKTNFH